MPPAAHGFFSTMTQLSRVLRGNIMTMLRRLYEDLSSGVLDDKPLLPFLSVLGDEGSAFWITA